MAARIPNGSRLSRGAAELSKAQILLAATREVYSSIAMQPTRKECVNLSFHLRRFALVGPCPSLSCFGNACVSALRTAPELCF